MRSKKHKENPSILQANESIANKKSHVKHFTAEKAVNLSLIFPQE